MWNAQLYLQKIYRAAGSSSEPPPLDDSFLMRDYKNAKRKGERGYVKRANLAEKNDVISFNILKHVNGIPKDAIIILESSLRGDHRYKIEGSEPRSYLQSYESAIESYLKQEAGRFLKTRFPMLCDYIRFGTVWKEVECFLTYKLGDKFFTNLNDLLTWANESGYKRKLLKRVVPDIQPNESEGSSLYKE